MAFRLAAAQCDRWVIEDCLIDQYSVCELILTECQWSGQALSFSRCNIIGNPGIHWGT